MVIGVPCQIGIDENNTDHRDLYITNQCEGVQIGKMICQVRIPTSISRARCGGRTSFRAK
jgi:hypothetical protein